jgi:hypothetical protein
VDWDFFVAGLGAPEITWGTRSVLLSFVRNHTQLRAERGEQVSNSLIAAASAIAARLSRFALLPSPVFCANCGVHCFRHIHHSHSSGLGLCIGL